MTVIQFLPDPGQSPPFSAIVTLDGVQYILACMWSVYRQDWYYSLTDQSGNIVIQAALIASPDGFDMPLALGIFKTSTIVFRDSTKSFEISS